jgi:3-oxoisoapionate kinase
MSALRCAFYADDFTGATDTLATWAEAGLAALLFLRVPDADRLARAGRLDVLGIAGAARAMGGEAMAAELAPVARFFATLETPVLHYKCCSTFDSAPQVGNLSTALRLLQPAAPNLFVPIVGGQPNLGRYCVFGHLHAAAGAGGEVFRIDRHPTMSRHPVTPMHESDLRRHLATLGMTDEIALIDWRVLDADATDETLGDAPRAVLFDALHDAHLLAIGRALSRQTHRGTLLALGASSVAQALIAAARESGEMDVPASAPRIAPAEGPVFAVAGSLSPVTAMQVEQAGAAWDRVPIDAGRVVADATALAALAADCAARLGRGRSVLAHTGPALRGGPAAAEVASACGRLLARVLEAAPQVRRVGVAGGDTSSLALRHLDAWALGCTGRLAPGVPLVRARSDRRRLDGLELMLKGGQMGPPGLFELLRAGT